jgi:hypothetical protein
MAFLTLSTRVDTIKTILSEPCTIIFFTIVSTLALATVINYDLSDFPSCGVTCDRHSDDSSGVIYDHNMFIVQATG